MTSPHVVVVTQNALLEIDLRPRREAEALAAAGYDVTLVGGCRSPAAGSGADGARCPPRALQAAEGGSGVAGQIREQSQAMARALRSGCCGRVGGRRVSVVHAGNPPDNLFFAGRAMRARQGSRARFVFDQHDAAPVLIAGEVPARRLSPGR